GEWDLCVRVQDNILADPVYAFGNHRILDELGLAINFRRQLAALPHFFFSRSGNLWNDDAFVDVALPYHGRVFVHRKRLIGFSRQRRRRLGVGFCVVLRGGRAGLILRLRGGGTLVGRRNGLGGLCE